MTDVQAQATVPVAQTVAPLPEALPEDIAAEDAETEIEVTEAEAETFTLDDVKRTYFGPDRLSEAQDLLNKIGTFAAPEAQVRNFDPAVPFPAGYGLGVIPLNRRTGSETGPKTETIGVAVVAVPDPALVLQHEKGKAFIADLITEQFLAKVANAAKPKDGDTTPPVLPYTIEHFMERVKIRESLKAFTTFASIIVKQLKKKGIKSMTRGTLQGCLMSEAYALQEFPKVSQVKWEKILANLMEANESKGVDNALLVSWLDNRTEHVIEEADEFDLEGFDIMAEV